MSSQDSRDERVSIGTKWQDSHLVNLLDINQALNEVRNAERALHELIHKTMLVPELKSHEAVSKTTL
jgi:hypothetical protein